MRELHVMSSDLGVLLGLGVALDHDPKTREVAPGRWAVTYTATLDGKPRPADYEDSCPCRALALARWKAMSEVLRRLDMHRTVQLTRNGIAPRWRRPAFE